MVGALRVTRVLRSGGDPFAYHVRDSSPLWKRVREALVVNPESSTGNPLPVVNRDPQPASRPEHFTVPSSKASDVAENPYWARDFRRMYPQTAFLTQGELSKLLLTQGDGISALPAPATGASSSTAVTKSEAGPSLASLYSGEAAPATTGFKPPTAPGKRYRYRRTEDLIAGHVIMTDTK